jgi:hypothetical protein
VWDYTEFEAVKEDWNILELEDGSLIKTKFVLIGLRIIEDEKGIEFDINSSNIVGVFTPPEKRGPPSDRDYSPKELRDSIINYDVSFKIQKEGSSEYKLQNGSKLIVKLVTSQISKTDKYDKRGNPIYLLQNTVVPKFIPKQNDVRIR